MITNYSLSSIKFLEYQHLVDCVPRKASMIDLCRSKALVFFFFLDNHAGCFNLVWDRKVIIKIKIITTTIIILLQLLYYSKKHEFFTMQDFTVHHLTHYYG